MYVVVRTGMPFRAYACKHEGMCVYMYEKDVCMNAFMYACMLACMSACMYSCMHVMYVI